MRQRPPKVKAARARTGRSGLSGAAPATGRAGLTVPRQPCSLPSLARRSRSLSKILSLIIILMMAVHLIKPLGLPGLKRRKDFWKLALIAIAAIVMTVAVRPGG